MQCWCSVEEYIDRDATYDIECSVEESIDRAATNNIGVLLKSILLDSLFL